MQEHNPDKTLPPVSDGEKTNPHFRVGQFPKPEGVPTVPPGLPDTTQRVRTPEIYGTETNEYHPDIMEFIDILNRESYTLMGDDGFIRTDLKVRRLDRVLDTWMITLFNPGNPDSALDELTMPLGQFERQRQRPVIVKD